MANCMMGFPNRIDQAVLSGGAWMAGLPRANLQDRVIGRVARTADAALASTQFDVDLGSAKKTRLVALRNHNFSLNAKYRIRGLSRPASTIDPNSGLMADLQADFPAAAASWAVTSGTLTPGASWTVLSATAIDAQLIKLGLTLTGKLNSLVKARIRKVSGAWEGIVFYMTPSRPSWSASFMKSVPEPVWGADGWATVTWDMSALTAGGDEYVSGSVSGLRFDLSQSADAVYQIDWIAAGLEPVSDSGWQDVWPVVYPYGSLEWEDDNWWSGKYTIEESEGYVAELVHILPSSKLARYWRIEIDDAANAAGHVQIGRVFIGPAWQPEINMIYGAGLGWETKTEVQEAIGGAEYFQRRTPYRVERFTLDCMTESEAFSQAFEMQRRAGIDQEILWVHDPGDTVHALRRRFLARLRTLSPIEFPYYSTNSAAFELKELL